MPTKQRNYNKPWDFLTVLFKLHSFQIQKIYIIEEFIFKKLIENFLIFCVHVHKTRLTKEGANIKKCTVRRFSFGHEQLNGQNRSRTLPLLYFLFYLCFKDNNYDTFLKKISIMECIWGSVLKMTYLSIKMSFWHFIAIKKPTTVAIAAWILDTHLAKRKFILVKCDEIIK